MRSPVSVTTAHAPRSIAATRVPERSATPAPATPFGPAIGASAGVTLPASTALDSGGFSYGSCCSSLSRATSAAASCCLAASAAATPAGPPPTTTILRAAFMRRLPIPHSGVGAIIDTSGRPRLDASEQRSAERNAAGRGGSARCDGEKKGTREERAAGTAPAPVLGGDRHPPAQGVLRGRGRDRHQRAGAPARSRQEHGPSAGGHAGLGGAPGAGPRERHVPARHRAVPPRGAGAPAHERLQRG